MEKRISGDTIVLTFESGLSDQAAQDVAESLRQARLDGCRQVLLNCAEVGRATLTTVVALDRPVKLFCHVGGGRVVLSDVRPDVLSVMQRASWFSHVNHFQTEQEGLDFLRGDRRPAD